MSKAEEKVTMVKLCNLMDLPISSYYHKPVEKTYDMTLTERLTALHQEHGGRYGKRRMAKTLQNEGFSVSIPKVARLMREANLIAIRPKKPHYYKAGKAFPNIPNLLNREFNQENMNTHWVGDITYIRSYTGWSYLATVMDLANREIIGYAISQTPDAQLAKDALIDAIKRHRPNTQGLLFHSDQGVQYSATLFQDALKLHGITQSMSRRGNCWDNAVQERFFRNLKTEYLNGLSFINHRSVVSAVEHYIRYYNYKRLNSAIDYLTPAQKRLKLLKVA
jgi:transposase InsO family protein